MKGISIEATYRRPNISKPAPGQKTSPYLLRKLEVTWPNQASAMNLIDIPTPRGFVNLCTVIDWFSRRA